MGDREPAVLIVLIQTVPLCWHVAAITSSGLACTLLRSEDGDLKDYHDLEFDSQLSFLRHRFAGVLQRGCDRLFARQMKANHFLLIADGHYPDAEETITPRLAEHFVEWMINPPVTYLLQPDGFGSESLDKQEIIAGEMPADVAILLSDGLPGLVDQLLQPEQWELVVRPSKKDC